MQINIHCNIRRGVAQEVLNFFDIRAILKASGSESMAEKVRSNIEVDTAVDPRVAIDLALLFAFLITLFSGLFSETSVFLLLVSP